MVGTKGLRLEIPPRSQSVLSVTGHSPAHTKGSVDGHFSEDTKAKELISRPLLYSWMHCLQEYLRPKPGDVYWWEEEQLTSLNTEKTSYRARLILRLKSSRKDDCIMPWSTKMAVKKAAREDAVRRAMHQVKNLKNVTFADKENVDIEEMRHRIKVF